MQHTILKLSSLASFIHQFIDPFVQGIMTFDFWQRNRNNWTIITNIRGALINEFCETVEDAMCAKKNKNLVLFLVRIAVAVVVIVVVDSLLCKQREELELIWIKINMDHIFMYGMCRAMLELLVPPSVCPRSRGKTKTNWRQYTLIIIKLQ